MIRLYVAFDDTDTLDCGRGTGKLARWYCEHLPAIYKVWGVVRQQLLKDPVIPMTSHNSALCCVIDAPRKEDLQFLVDQAAKHIRKHFVEGSDPGLCVVNENAPESSALIDFGIRCTGSVCTQNEARDAAGSCHLSGHGGSNGGIIGAAAAVGLTMLGESGRLVSYRDIRELPQLITAGELREREIQPLSAQRHAEYIPDHHIIDTRGSLRPHLSGRRLVVPLMQTEECSWQTIVEKSRES